MNQKAMPAGRQGFSQLIFMVIVGVIIVVMAGGSFWYYQKSAEQNKSASETQVSMESSSSEMPAALTEQPKPQMQTIPAPSTTQLPPSKDAPKPSPAPTPTLPTPAPPAPLPQAVVPNVTPSSTCARSFSPKFNSAPYYNGPLFDAHIHLPGIPEINKLLCTFDKEKATGAIGFYWSPFQSQSLEKMLAETESVKNDSSGKIRLFLMPKSYSMKTLEDIETTHKGLFTGYGELAFYNRGDTSQSYYPQSPDEQQFLDLYVLAGKNNFVVMIHPNQGQASAIENVLQKNPNVKFYFHGDEIEGAIIGLMNKYPNVYYSIDAVLSRLPFPPADALHLSNSENDYVSKLTQNFSAILNGAVNEWKTKIESHPDRFTWGTDRGGFTWHYGEEVSRLFEELSRAFIARLDPAVQEKYAYKNAESLLQNR